LSGILPSQEENAGPPGLPHNPNVRHAKVSDPEEANTSLPLTVMLMLTSTNFTVSSFLLSLLTGLNPFNLAAFGLPARCPTLKAECYHSASKDSLPGGWPAFRGGLHTRWIMRPCPAAQNLETEKSFMCACSYERSDRRISITEKGEFANTVDTSESQ